jgi:hypothetical protein
LICSILIVSFSNKNLEAWAMDIVVFQIRKTRVLLALKAQSRSLHTSLTVSMLWQQHRFKGLLFWHGWEPIVAIPSIVLDRYVGVSY